MPTLQESGPTHRGDPLRSQSANKARRATPSGEHFWAAWAGSFVPESAGESHDVYETTSTYGKFEKSSQNRIALIINILHLKEKPVPRIQGELKVLAKATMLMKTKAGGTADLIKATMSMKNKQLIILKPRYL